MARKITDGWLRGKTATRETRSEPGGLVARSFYAGGGKVVEAGETVTLERHDALSLAAIRKVEILG